MSTKIPSKSKKVIIFIGYLTQKAKWREYLVRLRDSEFRFLGCYTLAIDLEKNHCPSGSWFLIRRKEKQKWIFLWSVVLPFICVRSAAPVPLLCLSYLSFLDCGLKQGDLGLPSQCSSLGFPSASVFWKTSLLPGSLLRCLKLPHKWPPTSG